MITNILRVFMTRSARPFIFESNPKYNYNLDLNAKNLGLYFHIPFCKKICPFCPYCKIEYDRSLLKNFHNALLKEIKLVSGLAGKRKDIESIYFGGGTPALMVDYLPGIIDLVKNLFNIKGNMGIELHPRDINETLLEKLKKYGFNMISIGIQSFQDKCISFLEREKIDSIGKLRLVKEFKFTLVDVDLIFGMPGQTKKDLTDDFIIAVENGATQISTYPFIEFSYASIKNKPLNQKLKKQMLESLLDISEKTDYWRSSIWTFSKYNLPRYSSVTRDNFIGFGPSAATLLKNIFKINTFSVKEYIKCLDNNKLPTALSLKFSPRIRALYWLFWSSYNLNINRDNFYELFGKKLNDIFRFELYWAKKFKYIEKYNSGYKLTDKGAYLFHLIEQAYTRQYIDKTWRTALNNPWPKRIILY
jgi:oxygen-independent coproporphyrinogen-3 oxidase